MHLPAADASVGPILISFMDQSRPPKPTIADFQSTSLKDMVKFTTPAGYQLKTRFLEPRIPLVQSLALTVDEQLRTRLVEAARWSSTAQARAEGLIGIAGEHNPDHIKYFKEALLDQDLNIEFAAIEALQLWGRPEGVSYLVDASERAWSPIIKVYAAQALLRLGDDRGRQKLLDGLRDPNWLSRAMSARYLGELGRGDDADLLLSRIGAERDNDFVLAEVCIASLKLLAKQGPPPKRPTAAPSHPRPVPAPRNPFELEPLIVTAPRANVPRNLVDVRIDNDLVRLLENLANQPPPDEQLLSSSDAELSQLTTPTGFALKVRYSDLSVLLTEGLAGTDNYTLITRLETIARSNPSSRVRASALVALGYQPRRHQELSIFDDALRDQNVVCASRRWRASPRSTTTGPAPSSRAWPSRTRRPLSRPSPPRRWPSSAIPTAASSSSASWTTRIGRSGPWRSTAWASGGTPRTTTRSSPGSTRRPTISCGRRCAWPF